MCLKGFYLDERKGSAGRVGRREGESGRETARAFAHTLTHVVCDIFFLCTCACQTSHCVRLGTPVMLTDSDSPRPDQQAWHGALRGPSSVARGPGSGVGATTRATVQARGAGLDLWFEEV